jgi:hypothetical protein
MSSSNLPFAHAINLEGKGHLFAVEIFKRLISSWYMKWAWLSLKLYVIEINSLKKSSWRYLILPYFSEIFDSNFYLRIFENRTQTSDLDLTTAKSLTCEAITNYSLWCNISKIPSHNFAAQGKAWIMFQYLFISASRRSTYSIAQWLKIKNWKSNEMFCQKRLRTNSPVIIKL